MLIKHLYKNHPVIFQKTILFSGVFLVSILFGDSLLLFVGHLLHIGLEFTSSVLEHIFQTYFNLSKRYAQIAVFYVEFVIGVYLTWRLSLIACRKCKEMFMNVQCCLKEYLQETGWLRISLIMMALGSSMFLLT